MKQTCILVLGMHRSGTSALTGVLHLLDVYLGKELLEPQNDNQKGFYENKKLVQINEKILKEIDSYWHDVFYQPTQLECIGDTVIGELKKAIQDEFHDNTIFAIKDPRLALLFPIYEQVLSDLSINIKIIIPYRHPIEVAESLYKRDKFSKEKSLLLWIYSFLLAEKHSRGYDRIFVTFDELIAQTEETIRNISDQLHLKLFMKYQQNKNKVHTFLEPSLKHHNVKQEQKSVYLPKIIWDLLEMKSRDTDMSDRFDHMREMLFGYQKLFYHQEIIESEAALQKIKVNLTDQKNLSHKQDKALKEKEEHLLYKDQELETLRQTCLKQERELKTKAEEQSQQNCLIEQNKKEFQRQVQELERLQKTYYKQTKKLDQKVKKIRRQDDTVKQYRQQLVSKDNELKLLRKTVQELHHRLAQRDEAVRQNREQLQHQVEELEKLQIQHHKQAEESICLQNKLNILENELTLMFTSRSWMITRPIRKILRLLK